MIDDIRYGVRQLRKAPAFAALAVLLIALGTGANTAVFSLVRGVLLRPLPYTDPDRVVMLWNDGSERPPGHRQHRVFTGTHVHELRRALTQVNDFAAVESWQGGLAPLMDLVGRDDAERLRGAFVTPNFFRTLGVTAAQGRTFTDADGDASPVIVLSDAFWRRRFGADPTIIGRQLSLTAGSGRRRTPRDYTVVGVLAPEFRYTYPEETELWTVLPWTAIPRDRALRYQLIARLKPTTTIDAVEAEATNVGREIARGYDAPAEQFPAMLARTRIVAETTNEHVVGDARAGVWLLGAVAGLVLLMACVNLALLVLARTVDRRRELAVRASLGAAPRRLLRQLLVEGAVTALLGSAAGVALAWLLLPAFRAVVPAALPRGVDVSIDSGVLAFAIAISAAIAIVCGLVPAAQARRLDLQRSLKGGVGPDRAVTRVRTSIVACQAAVVVLLLVGAGLLLHSFVRMHRVDLGFNGDGVVTMEMRLLDPGYFDESQLAAFQARMLDEVRAVPGVAEASLTTSVPMRGVDFRRQVESPAGARTTAHERSIDAGYFKVMSIPLRSGRLFTSGDTAASEPVAIVSESLARTLFGGQDPVGRQIVARKRITIVGIAGDVRHGGVTRDAAPAYYVPRTQVPVELICLVARTHPDARGVAAEIRKAIQRVDPRQPVEKLTTLDRIVTEATEDQRFYTASTVMFGVVALLLGVGGIFGVASRNVTERRREIAVRMALGADPRRLVRHILGQSVRPVLPGVVAGLAGAFAASRLLARFLFEVKPADPLAFGVAALLVGTMAVAGSYGPARRASRTSPHTALKE